MMAFARVDDLRVREEWMLSSVVVGRESLLFESDKSI